MGHRMPVLGKVGFEHGRHKKGASVLGKAEIKHGRHKKGMPVLREAGFEHGRVEGELPLGALVSHFVREIKQFVGKGGAVESF